jgi:hypothetical protein
MAAGYVIAQLKVTNPDNYKKSMLRKYLIQLKNMVENILLEVVSMKLLKVKIIFQE